MDFLLPPGDLSGGFLGEKSSDEDVPRCTECQTRPELRSFLALERKSPSGRLVIWRI